MARMLEPAVRAVVSGRHEPERRKTLAVLLVVGAGVVLTRLVYAWQPLRSDEGGYLYVARRWNPGGGEFLYGDLFVDRSPLLLLVYRVAAWWEWDGAIRLLAIPFVLAGVVLSARAAYVLAGWVAARWAAVVTAALLSSPALAADQADGELFAVPFVAAGIVVVLEARRGARGATARFGWAAAAGILAAAATLVKQSFADVLVLTVALVVLDRVLRRRGPDAAFVLGFGCGVALPYALVIVWAIGHGLDLARVWADVVSFRSDALQVIWSGSAQAPALRGAALPALALVSGVLPLAWAWSQWLRRRARTGHGTPEHAALAVILVFSVAAMVAGGSYWPHYLLQLVVPLGIAAGVAAAEGIVPGTSRIGGSSGGDGRSVRRWSGFAAGSAVLCFLVTTAVYAFVPWVWFHERTGEWLAASAAHGDTVFVAYGSPSVLETADLATPYPYLWSLPMRTLDPEQERLRRVVAGSEAPTWIVELNGFNSWGIDGQGRLRALVESRYDVVARVCGQPVWLRADRQRDLAPAPEC